MKTQINELRSGKKVQILNPNVDYSKLPQATSHIGHGGSKSADVTMVWDAVKRENVDQLRIRIKGVELVLLASWSGSGKSVSYSTTMSKENLKEFSGLVPAKNKAPYISIQGANLIVIGNGHKSYSYMCPSLIEIL